MSEDLLWNQGHATLCQDDNELHVNKKFQDQSNKHLSLYKSTQRFKLWTSTNKALVSSRSHFYKYSSLVSGLTRLSLTLYSPISIIMALLWFSRTKMGGWVVWWVICRTFPIAHVAYENKSHNCCYFNTMQDVFVSLTKQNLIKQNIYNSRES